MYSNGTIMLVEKHLIQVFHVNELITSYIKMLELLELDLPNQSYS